METICVPKEKLGKVINDVEKLISDFENLIGDQDQIAKNRQKELEEGVVKARTEDELDDYLKQRGIDID